MIKLTEIVASDSMVDDTLTIPFDLRQKSRFSATTDRGKDVGLFYPRGQMFRSGIILTGTDDFKVQIKAANESVSVMRSDDCLVFSKACYHLGNRHISLHILQAELRYLKDHVLDHMLEVLGLAVDHEMLPFEPEAGAYHSHDH
ncbi:MAG: urease accessory protein UreE [Methylococcales symbiont of Hymedesmia sp. n. MRB-2018]|nr:MAG: urease accessory protein UreE [Methylococcales symbiont of Hymedesmia sp. n. MRB-2018]KAF3982840.1 MAG: urease accessory protein UreE [Methylococcales symbiont of Hymedesmia sp. n. MRB-2018]